MKYVTLLALFGLVACGDGKDSDSGMAEDTSEDTADTSDTSDTGTPATTVAATLMADGVELVIENGDAGGYDFGIVQSGTADDWTGEDCYMGYDLGTGATSQNCHSASATGGYWYCLDEDADGDCDYDGFESPNEAQTLFYDGLEGGVTFYLADSTGACWVWGDDVAYYSALGCEEI